MSIFIELLVWYFIRTQYEDRYSKIVIPFTLKCLIKNFSKSIFGSKIITFKQDSDFFNLLSTQLSIVSEFKLLFRASEHAFSITKFHQLCDGFGATITIIKSNFGHIFGAYTQEIYHPSKIKSHPDFGYITDKNAFIFLIQSNDSKQKCPILFKIYPEHANHAIWYCKDYGPTFGYGSAIRIQKSNSIRSDKSYDGSCEWCESPWDQQTFQGIDVPGKLCGKDDKSYEGYSYRFQVIEYEVFQVKKMIIFP